MKKSPEAAAEKKSPKKKAEPMKKSKRVREDEADGGETKVPAMKKAKKESGEKKEKAMKSKKPPALYEEWKKDGDIPWPKIERKHGGNFTAVSWNVAGLRIYM